MAELGSLDVFFDMRPVHGDVALADTVRADSFEAVKGQVGFARRLAEASMSTKSAVGWFGRPRLQTGGLDLEAAALSRIAALARAFAMRDGVMERSTVARLLMAEALEAAPAADLNAFAQAYEWCIELMLRQQLTGIAHGARPSSTIAVKGLPRQDRATLTAVLQTAARAERHIRALPAEN